MQSRKSFLTTLQWLSPSFPIGSFAYSHGLEWAMSAGYVTDEESLLYWMQDLIEFGSVRNDAILVSLAYRRAPEAMNITALNDMALALAPSRERRSETVLQGRAFVKTVNEVWDQDLPELCYPVAVGTAAKYERLNHDDIVVAYLQAFVVNLIYTAVRLVPLGQTQGQRVLTTLTPELLDISALAVAATDQDLTNAAVLSDIASMRHETLKTRVFKT